MGIGSRQFSASGCSWNESPVGIHAYGLFSLRMAITGRCVLEHLSFGRSKPPGSRSVTIWTAAWIFPDKTMELYRCPDDSKSKSQLWLSPQPSSIPHSSTSLTRATNHLASHASILAQSSGFVSENLFATLVFLRMQGASSKAFSELHFRSLTSFHNCVWRSRNRFAHRPLGKS